MLKELHQMSPYTPICGVMPPEKMAKLIIVHSIFLSPVWLPVVDGYESFLISCCRAFKSDSDICLTGRPGHPQPILESGALTPLILCDGPAGSSVQKPSRQSLGPLNRRALRTSTLHSEPRPLGCINTMTVKVQSEQQC